MHEGWGHLAEASDPLENDTRSLGWRGPRGEAVKKLPNHEKVESASIEDQLLAKAKF